MTAPAPQPTKKSIWKNKWFWIVIGAVFVIGIIANLVNPTPKYAIPDVAGMTAIEATAELEAIGFRVTLSDGSNTVRDGELWDATGTDPAAGTELGEGDRVTILVTEATERIAELEAAEEAARAEEEATQAAEREEAAAASAARGASLEQAIKDAFGGAEFSEILVSDPSLWAGWISGVRVEGGDAYITLQLYEEGPEDDIGDRAARALTTLLPASELEGIGWIIVEDAGGVVIGQEMVR